MKKGDIIKRLSEYFEYKGISQRDLAHKLGYQGNSSISDVLNEKVPLSPKFKNRLWKAFPELNRDWLISGRLPMENQIDPWMKEPDTNYQPKVRPLNEIKQDPNGKRIPALDIDVYASIAPSLSDVVALKPAAFINIPMFNQGEFAVMVTGHSMKGFINHGDWVIIKRLTNRQNFIPGEAHLIVTKADNIKTVKFIKPCAEDDTKITLQPYNTLQFEPHDFPKDDILEVYKIIGLFRSV